MSNLIRNRIKDHRRVRAGDLVPHEWNFRTHPGVQRRALQALYEQVGFARSLLAYELPDGRLKLIDGHLRRDIDPDMEVDVEVLDVNDEEARTLLLSIDPLAALAQTQAEIHERLLNIVPTPLPELAEAWRAANKLLEEPTLPPEPELVDQFLIVVTCRDEKQQIELLRRFKSDGLKCKPLLS